MSFHSHNFAQMEVEGLSAEKPAMPELSADVPGMEDLIDRPDEIFADRFGVSLAQAREILAWHESAANTAVMREKAALMSRVVGFLIRPQKNMRACVLGLAYSWGLASRINGAESMNVKAGKIGCTRALLSFYKRQWDGVIASPIRVFGKSPEACEKYRAARIRVVAQTKNKKEKDQ